MAYLWLSNTKEKIQGEKGENKKKIDQISQNLESFEKGLPHWIGVLDN